MKKPALLSVLLLFISFLSFSEGTRELWPTGAANEKCGPQIWDNGNSNRQFATYNSAPEYRLNIHIRSTSEVIYYGFDVDASAFSGNLYYQIKDPNGNIVVGPNLVPTSGSGFINNWTEASAGPNTFAVGGYSPLSYAPTMTGDYYIEFNPGDPVTVNQTNTRFQYFDITVGDGVTPQTGRLWSQNWDLTTYSFSNNCNAEIYIYSNDGVVSELDLNGMQPFGFEVHCNGTGPQNTGNPIVDRQSVGFDSAEPDFKIFLNDPDNLSYPTGAFSTFGTRPTYIDGCNGTYCVYVDYAGAGYAEVLLDFDDDGINNNNDVLLTGNVSGGYHCFQWDGLDASGTLVTHGVNVSMNSTILAGMTHYPVFDAENNPNGFIITTIRPVVPNPSLFFDDTQVGGTADLLGCSTPCHAWGGNFGNQRTINSWWFGASVMQQDSIINNHCSPVAVDDNLQGTANAVTIIDVLNIGVDSDQDGDDFGPESVGTDFQNGLTASGGTVVVNDNGTPNFLGDDFIQYTPLSGWSGLDSTYYVLLDEMGGRDTAKIRVFIWNDDDLDGVFGTADLDSDNDGILDIDEDGGTGFDPSDDADADGIPNYTDNSDLTTGFPAFIDVNLDGINDRFDNDLDGVPDFVDLDSDNDGITDAIEASLVNPVGSYSPTLGRFSGTDTDGDGLMDDVDNDPTTAFGPGSTSPLPLPDTDNDGVRNDLDIDSDNDGITDVIEAGGMDIDGNGILDSFSDLNGDGVYDSLNIYQLSVPNTDGTGLADYLDLDADGDGIDDTSEGFSTNSYPGTASGLDSDFDGLLDMFDISSGNFPAIPEDTDADGTPDYQDLDTEEDGNPDLVEGHDNNGDGIADINPSGFDNDNDGIDDAFDTDGGTVFGTTQSASLPNQDSDSEPDWRDTDDLLNPGIFYYTCDITDELYSYNVFNGTSTFVGSYNAQANLIESIAHWDGVLYAADAGNFGTLNVSNGAFTLIGEIDGGGTANGSNGPLSLNDVDGMSFDPWTGILWASNRRNGDYDVLFQIDPLTGQFVQDAFGASIDYLIIDGAGVFQTIDDIAISPLTGEMFTVGNDGGSDQLLKISKYTGAISVVGNLSQQDIEGMTYYNAGDFYGTIGSNPGEFWEIDPGTAAMSNQQVLPCGDPEAVAALVAPPNRISGKVWEDVNFDQVINGSESGVAGIVVHLYYDVNGNGVVDPSDLLLQTETTDANGDYTFVFGTVAELVIEIDLSSLSSGYALTTDNVEQAVFSDNVNFNEIDANNDFGIATDSDCDNDGIPDFAEGGLGVDFDNDGVFNMCDLDSDNDGILDSEEGLDDTDGDGLPNYTDLDSDNDGITDAVEANDGIAPSGYNTNQGYISGLDTDGDGLLDGIDADPTTQYGGGSVSNLSVSDHDIDGIPDYLDIDSDNDGIVDLIEASGTDSDGDGRVDGFNDGNQDGLSDGLNTNPLAVPNSDANGNPDYIDFDSDGDGLDDILEGYATGSYTTPSILSDADGDGLLDFWDVDLGGTPISPTDTDMDGTPDFQDIDSDDDTILDSIEGNDANSDGIQDVAASGIDTDGDGLDDAFDAECLGSVPNFGRLDYAEEDLGNGSIDLGSSDLELAFDGNQQAVGILFGNVSVPQGAVINNAQIQFQTDESFSGTVTLTIVGEEVNNSALFTTSNSNVSSRTPTSSSVVWSPPNWTVIGEEGVNQQTVDLSSIVQEIVDRPGWTSGNNMTFIITGTGTNRRTAENDPILTIDYAGGTVSWGCATNLPHQNTDGDAEDDWRDTDDDDDGISTLNEPGDIDGNGTADYLEASVCGPGQTLVSVSGNADVVVASNLVTNPANGLGSPDGIAVTYQNNNGSRVDFDMTDTIPAGTTMDITWRKISGGGQARFRIFWSATGTGGWTQIAQISTTSTSFITTQVTVPNDARYFRIRRSRRVPGLDAISYSYTDCSADKDLDGIPDALDLDDDNDGIADAVEGTGDADNDGVPNSCDLDSDNDGLPDALEANSGVLPSNMGTGGQYLNTYVANPANDLNGDGWIEQSEGGPAYSDLAATPVNSDNGSLPDYFDLDSDDDCIPDALEAFFGVTPSNMDDNGQYTSAYAALNDIDGDGLVDDVDPSDGGTALSNPDTDNDGVPNYIDTDSDEDGLSDALEAFDPNITMANSDSDLDGLDDSCDPDNGGIIANMPDDNCNGVFDYIESTSLTNQSGDYTISSTWFDGTVPVSGRSIVVSSGHDLVLTGNTVVASITVEAGATLDIAGFELTVLGNMTIDGNFIHNLGKTTFSGTCPQDICGNMVLYDIEIDNGNGVSMSCGDISIENALTLTNGVLDACSANSVTLVSSASEQGYIAAAGNGTVNCDLVRERFKLGCQDGFMLIATPYATNTYNDWSDDFLLTGFPGTAYPNFWTSVYLYDETQPGTNNDGWYAPSNISSGIPRGLGHYAYIGAFQLPNTIDMAGQPDLSDHTFDLSYTSYGNGEFDGYNLLGNPYPSPIDWDGPGWTNVGCCNAVWTWNECNTQFSSYIDGVETNDGTNVIESCQAFWVKAHIPGAMLACSRASISDDEGDFKSLNNVIDKVLKIGIDGFSSSDETAVRLLSGSSHACDNLGDAFKQISNETLMGIYTVASDGQGMSINAFPNDTNYVSVPVMVRVPNSGSYTLDFFGGDLFPEDICLLLEDLVTGDIIDLKTSVYYTFNQNTSSHFNHRFNITVSYPIQVKVVADSCGESLPYAVFEPNGVGPYDVVWKDEHGQTVHQAIGISESDSLLNMPQGEYFLSVIDHGAIHCNIIADTVHIPAPHSPMLIQAEVVNTSCTGNGADGRINIQPTNGMAPYIYSWSNGANTQDISGLESGQFDVEVEDARGCTVTGSFSVENGNDLRAEIAATDIVNLAWENADVKFVSSSVGAKAHVWYSHDGMTSLGPIIQKSYTDTGLFEMVLAVSDGSCSDTAKHQVRVIDDPSIAAIPDMFGAWQNEDHLMIVIKNNTYTNVFVAVFDLSGRKVDDFAITDNQSEVHRKPISRFSEGVYLVQIVGDGNTVFSTKVFIQNNGN